jgi:hypothetical protein
LWLPLYTLFNEFVGYLGCIILFMGLYYNNIFRSQDFPFMAQELFDGSSNATVYNVYNQSEILNSKFQIDSGLLAAKGTPFLTGTYLGYLITSNMGFTATFVHMLLWNFNDIKQGWLWLHPTNLKKALQPGAWVSYPGTTRLDSGPLVTGNRAPSWE